MWKAFVKSKTYSDVKSKKKKSQYIKLSVIGWIFLKAVLKKNYTWCKEGANLITTYGIFHVVCFHWSWNLSFPSVKRGDNTGHRGWVPGTVPGTVPDTGWLSTHARRYDKSRDITFSSCSKLDTTQVVFSPAWVGFPQDNKEIRVVFCPHCKCSSQAAVGGGDKTVSRALTVTFVQND